MYTIEQYFLDIDTKGLYQTWDDILTFVENNKVIGGILSPDNFGLLYEKGLAYLDKGAKKESGVYYTPSDVASVLADFFIDLQGENVCDVCCGTGNLILSYLSKLGDVENFLKSGKLYLYDMDELALKICKRTIGILYGVENIKYIHTFVGDFLNKDIVLPSNCKVISNPPYFKILSKGENWEDTEVLKDSKELYSVFMEKIIKQSKASVLITPFSFIGGEKFYSLRKVLNNYNGYIFSFDNVPGNIFKGKKEGIFNTNNVNSVRAAITVVENISDKQGFVISPLLRFDTSERSALLNKNVLMQFVSDDYQIVSETEKRYYKCFFDIIPLYKKWIEKSEGFRFLDLLTSDKSEYSITMVKTCRYFVSATKRDLDRAGKIQYYFKDEDSFYFAYAILNSSFAYLYWRMFDGAIIYPDGLLKSMPVFKNRLIDTDWKELKSVVNEMIKIEGDYLTYKKNASEMQESVKFPEKYRMKLNEILIKSLECSFDFVLLEKIHKNKLGIVSGCHCE